MALATENAGVTRGHFVRIDGLRAIAALGVFFTHVGATKYRVNFPVTGFDNTVRVVLDELTVGVSIFFGISGFVLLRPFVARHVAGNPPVQGSGYFVRRALRIYPAYWVALLGSVFVIRGVVTLSGGWRWFANLALIQSYSTAALYKDAEFQGMLHAWTLVVEVTFYVFLAAYASVIGRLVRRRDVFTVEWTGLGVLALLSAGAITWIHVGSAPLWVTVLPDRMPLFLVGMALAVLTAQAEQRGSYPRAVAAIGRHPGLCVATALAAFSAVAAMSTNGPSPWLATLLLHVLLVAALLSVAVLPQRDDSRSRRALRTRPAIFCGTISYGIYLWHYAIVRWVADNWFDASQGQTMLKVTVTALPASLLMGWLSFRVVERPAMRLGERLTRPHRGTPGPS